MDDSYNRDTSQVGGPLDAYLHMQADSEIERMRAILHKYHTQLEKQAEAYDAMNWQYIPQATKDRKFYAIDAQMTLLRDIMNEIGGFEDGRED